MARSKLQAANRH